MGGAAVFSHGDKPFDAHRKHCSTDYPRPMTLFNKRLNRRRDQGPAEQPADRAKAVALIDAGNAEEASGRPANAMRLYQEALRIAPTLPRAHLNVGNVRLASGDAVGALVAYQHAVAVDPQYLGGHFNLGNALQQLGRHDEALAAYRRAAEIDPQFINAPIAIGNALQDQGQFERAAEQYRAALALDPTHAPALSNLGSVLLRLRQFDAAIACQRRAIKLAPALAQAHNNLGNALKDIGELRLAQASYGQVLALEPQWLDARSNMLFCLNYMDDSPAQERLEQAQEYGTWAARRARRYTSWHCSLDSRRPLRIGLVSGDLRDHPVAYFLEDVLAAFHANARDRVSVLAYASAPCTDAVSERLKCSTTAWKDVQMLTDEALAAQIHNDHVDILIDLSGHTAHTRLPVFAWRPSPVQVTWLGYFATTGVAEIDYLIADQWTLPKTLEGSFTERIWRLPDTRLCFSAPRQSPAVNDLPATTSGTITFGCFNHLAKVNDRVVAVWSRILHALPNSRLLLKSPPLESSLVRSRTEAQFSTHGIPADRLMMEGLTPRPDYLATYGRVDIALDPFPYPGGTTTAEALWMGVPVVTLAGHTFLSRQGAGLLANVNLTEWIAKDHEDYVEIAIGQARNVSGLVALRRGLRAALQASPLMDATRFADHLEAALRGMWLARRWGQSAGMGAN
jgi:protein O-GlcNAc transferase